MIYAAPGAAGAKIQYQAKYDNFIGGKWVAPVKGQYFDVISPINGRAYTKAARSGHHSGIQRVSARLRGELGAQVGVEAGVAVGIF